MKEFCAIFQLNNDHSKYDRLTVKANNIKAAELLAMKKMEKKASKLGLTHFHLEELKELEVV